MQLNVKYLFPEIKPLISRDGDSGYDLRAHLKEPLTIEPHKCACVPTGIAVEIADFGCKKNNPLSIELQVRPRSGLTKRGLIAQLGTIDASYRGEIWVNLVNNGDELAKVEPNDRIAQLVICPIYKLPVVPVTKLSDTERGTNGFGSTGVK
ncbi:MAG: dUTP diphosphatase [Alphaproteobacteria bacterium]|nr:dUTP diphosphatase [Alphaproteobacteria bacterium]